MAKLKSPDLFQSLTLGPRIRWDLKHPLHNILKPSIYQLILPLQWIFPKNSYSVSHLEMNVTNLYVR
jgi:hypothetical protein